MEFFQKCKKSFHPTDDKNTLLLHPKNYVIVYCGSVDENNLPHGKGIQYSTGRVSMNTKEIIDGTRYYYGRKCRYGYWNHGKLCGSNCYHWYKNGMMYKGTMLNDKPHGYGTVYNKKKTVDQVGHWNNGSMFNGYGTIFYEDGSRYKGDVINGMRWGDGIMYDSKGKENIIGHWIKNHRDEERLVSP